MPRLRLIAGPNGAGKTSLMRTLVENKVPVGQYINPDDIARHINLNEALRRSREVGSSSAGQVTISKDLDEISSVLIAQAIATGLREDWLSYQLSLTYESVMSHESHLSFVDKAVKAKFEPYLYYICTSDPAINTARVAQRVERGGHSVPADKIVTRYHRSLGLLHRMAQKCRRLLLYCGKGSTVVRGLAPDHRKKGFMGASSHCAEEAPVVRGLGPRP